MDEILDSVCTLAQDQYGNYVTQVGLTFSILILITNCVIVVHGINNSQGGSRDVCLFFHVCSHYMKNCIELHRGLKNVALVCLICVR